MCPPHSWSCVCASWTVVVLLLSPVVATWKDVTALPSSGPSIEPALQEAGTSFVTHTSTAQDVHPFPDQSHLSSPTQRLSENPALQQGGGQSYLEIPFPACNVGGIEVLSRQGENTSPPLLRAV